MMPTMRARCFWVSWLLIVMSGCFGESFDNKDDPSSCDSACLSDERCAADGSCHRVCEVADDCPGCGVCDEGLCYPETLGCAELDGNPCTVPTCTETGCQEVQADDGEACEADGDLCTVGTCSVSGCTETDKPCGDDVDCTEDRCDSLTGNCVNAPNDAACDDTIDCTTDTCDPELGCSSTPVHAFCVDTDPCSADVCDAIEGCSNDPLPSYSLCDDGSDDTGPDVCRSGVCVGAIAGELSTGMGIFKATDAEVVGSYSAVVVNDSQNAQVHLHTLTDSVSSTDRGNTPKKSHRIYKKGDVAYVAAETPESSSGGLDCYQPGPGTCPVVGMYNGGDSVVWNGSAMHAALAGNAMGAQYHAASFVDREQTACETPPCYDDVHWWFVGTHQSAQARPSAIHCLEEAPSLISCTNLGSLFFTTEFNDTHFVGVEVTGTNDVLDPEFVAALFGLSDGVQSWVVVDADFDPDGTLTTTRQGPFPSALRGSMKRSCNKMVFYGDDGLVICSAPNIGGLAGCEAGTPWTCAPALGGNDIVQARLAGPMVLVTPQSLLVNVSGDPAENGNWTTIDFDLEDGVALGAMAGDSTGWFVFANDSNTGKVRVYRFWW